MAKADILSQLKADIAALERGAAPSSRVERPPQTASAQKAPARTCFGSQADDIPLEDGAASGQESPEKTADGAYQKILRWASVRERSSAYVRDRLSKDEYPAPVVEEALARAQRVRAIDDRRYADALVRMRLASGKGLRDAEREIEELGIDPASLDSWIAHNEQGRDVEIERALGVLRRRPPRAKRAREAAFRKLMGQGYATDVASSAARLWAEEAGV